MCEVTIDECSRCGNEVLQENEYNGSVMYECTDCGNIMVTEEDYFDEEYKTEIGIYDGLTEEEKNEILRDLYPII